MPTSRGNAPQHPLWVNHGSTSSAEAGVTRKKSVLTNTNVAATDAVLDISGDVEVQFDHLSIGQDNYTIPHTATIQVLSGTDLIANLVGAVGVALDDQKLIPIPGYMRATSPAAAEVAPLAAEPFRLYAGDKVRVTVAALAQNETMTVFVRARAPGGTVTLANASAAGVTIVTTDA